MANRQDSGRQEIGTPTHSDVARRAYELFQARGGEPGHELENWLEAERELGSIAGKKPQRTDRGLRPSSDRRQQSAG
jgi:hypothetical protein